MSVPNQKVNTAYSFAQLEGYWISAGGPAAVAPIAAAIAIAESGGRNVIQSGQPYSTTGWGLWQITPGNSVPNAGTDNALLDPMNNAKAAVAKYRGAGNSFGPWTTYTSGAYRKYLQAGVPADLTSITLGPSTIPGLPAAIGNLPDTSLFTYAEGVLAFFGSKSLTAEHFIGIAAWSACEGPVASQGKFNPLNTTFPGGHSAGSTTNSKAGPVSIPSGNSGYLGNDPNQNNGDPVKNYTNWASGISAAVATMLGGPIEQVLKNPNTTANDLANAVGQAGWGTNPSCIVTKANEFRANPNLFMAALSQNVAPAGQGGASMGADQGQANPELNFLSVNSVLGTLGKILSTLGSVAFWKRLGLGSLGLGLILLGVAFILSESKTVKDAAGAAAVAAI